MAEGALTNRAAAKWSRARRSIATLLLLGVGVGVSGLLFEAGLRLLTDVPRHDLHTVSAASHARVPGLWEPGQALVRRVIPALPHRVRINALGLRGAETTLEPRQLRLLCLGDSFTFGDHVDDEDTLPVQLGRALGGAVEVLNGGVGGTTIVDQRVLLERMLPLQPAVVLLLFHDNDLEDLLADPPLIEAIAENRARKSGWLAPVYQLVRNSASFHAALRLHGMLRAGKVADRLEDLEQAGSSGQLSGLMDRYLDELVAARALLAGRGVELVFARFPSHLAVSAAEAPDPLAPLLQRIRALDVRTVDLTQVLRDSGKPVDELFLLPDDGHASAEGYRIAAAALRPHLARALELAAGP